MDYIYIDESGDLGDKGSEYFILSAIKVYDKRILERLITKTRRSYRKDIGKSNEIKGTTTPPKIKKSILNRINNLQCEIFIIIFNKRNKYKLDYNYDNHILYDILSSELIKLIEINNTTEIFFDRTKNNDEKIIKFNNRIMKNLSNPNNFKVSIKQADSLKYKGIQIADIISWSTYQCIENNNNEYINLINNKTIKLVFED
ncbi:MAG: hypothetical protein BZ138_08295 [Methanosphaera sp. rholeuAM270]|nr:MAG: hypothetical protein BZ138_08295 [Methanosphaera sp. rholeuAM270]